MAWALLMNIAVSPGWVGSSMTIFIELIVLLSVIFARDQTRYTLHNAYNLIDT